MSAHDPMPCYGQLWKNLQKQELFCVDTVANLTISSFNLTPTVVFRDMKSTVWAMPLHEWYEKFDLFSS